MSMNLVERLAHALRRHRDPPTGVLVGSLPEDSFRSYPADGLTPQRLLTILRNADQGDLDDQMALYEQMEEKDAHLYSVAQTRRLAVLGLPWRIVPASSVDSERYRDRRAAEETAAFCKDALHRFEDFESVLSHLARGIGRNIALAELVWEAGAEGLRVCDVAPIDFSRLRTALDGTLRILTAEEPINGIEPPADKFIIHRPHGPGHAGRGGLLRVTAFAFLAKHFAVKDWLIFMEVFGMPVRIARYGPGATPEEKRELLDMMKLLGTDAAGIFSKSVDLEIKQTRVPGDVAPYESICHYFNRELSKAWLGQTLTTDTARSLATARGAAEVHDRVRRDIRDHDVRQEARTIRRDLLGPIVRLGFGPDAPVPFFVRSVDQPREPRELARVLSVAVNELGMRVPSAWAHEALHVPESKSAESVLSGSNAARGEDGG
ncbi:MAG: DUF935 family protein [Phycisphaerae bacterium]